MKSALIYVFFALITQKEGSRATSDSDFRPTPIPLNNWQLSKRDGRAGTLQEIIGTDASPSVAAVPAHYWEDALRHSVYLTLVRDKIDQLIAKGTVITPDKPHQTSKEVDDHDLWEKIKTAPFDRLKDKEPASFGDVTTMAKGRLLEDNQGFRFAEDENTKERCSGDKCLERVKAYWSVKRVRQRDVEPSAGKYHYELTFSVISQAPKKQSKPHENPARTFTVRESIPVDHQQRYRIHEPVGHIQRPQRAIWFHKNIVPTPHQGRNYHQGLDRIFSSLFSEEESHEDLPPRYKQNPYVPQTFPQHSKIGYVGSSTEQHQQKKLTPYPYKPHSYKYSPHPLPAPPVTHAKHHYLDQEYHDVLVNNPYPPPHTDYRYLSSNIVKTTRPAVLPTPPGAVSHINVSMEVTNRNRYNATDATTKDPEIITGYKLYTKPKPTPMKISYFTDHIRPPVFNAPPGVFVTMDKKPFKPMPPLKLLHTSKPFKNKPTDFRPSPQVLDIQFSDPDSLSDAFRPITINYADSNTTDSEENDSNKKGINNIRKSKPPKKHELIKSQRITTTTPDIITAHSESDEITDTMEWANLLGAFTKTTPMASQKENITVTESTEPVMISTLTTTVKTRPTTTEIEENTSTTPKPKKRTRPPPKFTKPEKIKKHKRVKTTTTTTTTTKAPEKAKLKRPVLDLTPQASSAATSGTKSGWQPKSKSNNITLSSTPISTTTKSMSTTTSQPSTSTTQSITTTSTSTTRANEPLTTKQGSKNRFRQSTLMQKGTSVNHDKWSVASIPEKNRTVGPLSSKYPPRRKGSNFHGYVPSSTPRNTDVERNKDDHVDHVNNVNTISSTKETTIINKAEDTSKPTQPTYEDSADQYETNSETSTEYSESDDEEESESEENNEEREEQESKDHSEYMFHLTSATPSKKINEITDTETLSTTEETIVISPHSIVKNKTKCKKKKHNNLTPQESLKDSSDTTHEKVTKISTITTTTEKPSTSDIFEDLFDGFTMDESTERTTESQSTTKSEPEEGESENHEHYVQIDEDFEDFLDSLEGKRNHNVEKSEEEYEDNDTDEEDSPFDNEDENHFGRQAQDESYDDYQDRPRPYSFLELMAME